LDLEDEDFVVPSEVAENSADIVGDMLKYAGEQDCSLERNITKQLNDDFKSYLDKIVNGLLSDKITNEEGVVF